MAKKKLLGGRINILDRLLKSFKPVKLRKTNL